MILALKRCQLHPHLGALPPGPPATPGSPRLLRPPLTIYPGTAPCLSSSFIFTFLPSFFSYGRCVCMLSQLGPILCLRPWINIEGQNLAETGLAQTIALQPLSMLRHSGKGIKRHLGIHSFINPDSDLSKLCQHLYLLQVWLSLPMIANDRSGPAWPWVKGSY